MTSALTSTSRSTPSRPQATWRSATPAPGTAAARIAVTLVVALAVTLVVGGGCGKGSEPGGTPGGQGGSTPAGTGGSAATPNPGGSAPAGTGGTTAGKGGTTAPSGGGTGTGGNAGSAPPDAGGVDTASAEIKPMPPLPPRRAGFTIIHSTNVSMWEIHDPAVYERYKANFDEIISILERGYFGISARLGTGHELPLRVIIEAGGCCGGWAGGGDVGYADGDFKDEGAMNWVRGVVIGEVVNGVTGAVSSDWPRDWWADTAWYFPGFVTVDVLKDVVPAHAMKWEVDEKYPSYPVYALYKALLAEKGWPLYRKLFAQVKADKMDWSKVGQNPSALKTNYVVAYLSLAAGENLGDRFKAAKVNGVDTATVGAIMAAHEKLAQSGTPAAWAKFRAGDHAGAAGM